MSNGLRSDLASLNTTQRQAVMWPGGPLLVLAGPGSGKTRVLTMRAAWLLQESAGKRFRLLALTFTVKAANEMKQRLDEMLDAERERARVSTFHGFAAEVLRQHGSHVGLSPNFEIISDDAERRTLLRNTIRGLAPEDVYEADEARLLGLVDIYTERGWDAAAARRSLRDDDMARFVDRVASEYVKQLVCQNLVDFPSIIGLTTRLLATKPGVARQVHIAYSHVLVDEFQDTNPAQFALLAELVGPNKNNLFVVGDDDQIIYQWNGAHPRRIDELQRRFGTAVLQLPTNFRCPPAIVQLANDLIVHNASRVASKEPLEAVRQDDGQAAIRARHFEDLDVELQWIAADILGRGLRPGGVVLLCRSNRLAKVAVDELCKREVPCAQPKRKTDYDSAGVRFIVLAARAVNSPANPDHLSRLAEAVFELSGKRPDLDDTTQRALEMDTAPVRALLEALNCNEYGSLIPALARCAVRYLLDGINPKGFVNECLSSLKAYYDAHGEAGGAGFEGFAEDADIIRDTTSQWARRSGQNQSIASFIQELQLAPKVVSIPKNAVLCLTVHTAKGLEFEHVYLFGMVDGQFPSYQAVKSGDQSSEMEEERRNCFVAVTRASSSLTITWASKYFGYRCQPSRFLREMKLMAPAG